MAAIISSTADRATGTSLAAVHTDRSFLQPLLKLAEDFEQLPVSPLVSGNHRLFALGESHSVVGSRQVLTKTLGGK